MNLNVDLFYEDENHDANANKQLSIFNIFVNQTHAKW